MNKIINTTKAHGLENYAQKYIEQHNYMLCKNGFFTDERTGNKLTDTVKFIEDIFCLEFPIGSQIECVYMIGGFYIGATENLRKRLLGHTRDCINSKHFNKEFQSKFMECLGLGLKMPVSVLSYDRKEERGLIKRYSEIYDLCNVESNPKKNNK